MKKTNLNQIDKDKIIDVMFEPDKHCLDENGNLKYFHQYSILIENGSRKEITRKEFLYLLNYPLGLESY